MEGSESAESKMSVGIVLTASLQISISWGDSVFVNLEPTALSINFLVAAVI